MSGGRAPAMDPAVHVRGKVALVSGAAKGIGAACATLLAEQGAAVLVADVDAVAGQGVADGIAAAGGRAAFLPLDVTREADWQRGIDMALTRFGGLDVLVNNAGIAIVRTLLETTLEDWRRVHAVNVEGVFLGTRCAVEAMRPGGRAGRGGSIVNLSSVGGMIGAEGLSAYCSTKGAVRLFTKAVAIECGRARWGIRVNSVHPGNTDTPMFRQELEDMRAKGAVASVEEALKFYMNMQVLPEIGQPRDIAAMVLFLASDAARFVTGAEFVVDGGLTAQ